MARPRRRQRQEIGAQRGFVGSAIGPKGPPRFPIGPQASVVRDSVLDNQSFDPLRVGQNHPKAHRAAVILHVQCVARKPERFGKVIHDLSDMIERVSELFRVRPIAMSKARIIRSDHVIAIGKPGEERLEHPRGRGKSVQQQKRGRVFRPGLSVEDGKFVNLYRAIKGRVPHKSSFRACNQRSQNRKINERGNLDVYFATVLRPVLPS